MKHRDTITNLIHSTCTALDEKIAVVVDDEGFHITEDNNSITVELVARFIDKEEFSNYSYITLNMSVWGAIKILKISNHNMQVKMILDAFINQFSQAYKQAVESDRVNNQASQAVKALSDNLIIKKLTEIEATDNDKDLQAKFELIKNILVLA